VRREQPTDLIVRFSYVQRIEHFSMILLFAILLLTGMPQKWPNLEISRWTVDLMGGIWATRYIHRWVGIVFAVATAFHIVRVSFLVISRRVEPNMLFSRQDFHDAIDNLRYYLGSRQEPPKFGRYDYRQKLEYWGLMFGGIVMVITGFILYLPGLFARFLPAELIPASKVMHSNEALLAFLMIIVWHAYTAHLNPDVFPFDPSIFTGKISRERLAEEHALEYEELEAREAASQEVRVES
jgi:formate dehydrogenase gamma subunit